MDEAVVATANLASARRTSSGVVDQLTIVGMGADEIAAGFRRVGLPAQAMHEPEFPVGRDQELQLLLALVARLRQRQEDPMAFALRTFSVVGVNHYGVIGLAAQHAPSIAAAMTVFLDYPELSWGHSRVVVRRERAAFTLAFEMGAEVGGIDGAQAADLAAYCVTRDLASITRLLADLGGEVVTPTHVELPGAPPPFGRAAFGRAALGRAALGCPLHFGAPLARVCYPAEVADVAPLLASPLVFARYEKIARTSSRMLADDAPLVERVTRLLWAYTPAPGRQQVADMLALGERTLARRLRADGTSFQELLNRVLAERAGNYLLHTALSVTEISDRLGYADPAAFSRAFQGWYGEPPSRWRAAQRSSAEQH